MRSILNGKIHYTSALIGICALIVLVTVVGLALPKPASSVDEGLRRVSEDHYELTARRAADFQPVIVEKFNEESRLVVYSAQASETIDLKQAGILDISILNKTQTVTYRGGASFYVDLTGMSASNIVLDSMSRTVVISVPHTKMEDIEIDPDAFSAEETKKGLLAFGDLRFTAREYNSLETEVKKRMAAALNTRENLAAADERAIEEMTKIYDPLVKEVDGSYGVKIAFIQ